MSNVFLLADIGGTHVRFSTYDGAKTSQSEKYRTREFFTFEDAAKAHIQKHGLTVSGMIIGAAGIRQNNMIKLTNCPWVIDTAVLKEVFKIDTVILLNDFTLQGLGILSCAQEDYMQIGAPEGAPAFQEAPSGPRAVIGAGTGLGVCFLVADNNNRYQVFESEGGHLTISGSSVALRAVIAKANEKLPHVSFERLVSGTGLLLLYQVVGENYAEWAESVFSEEIVQMQRAWAYVQATADSDKWQPVSAPPEITALAEQGNEIALMTYWLFFEFLGVFCSDMALTMKTTGGVYLVGDLLAQPFISRLLRDSFMRKTFENKGRFRDFLHRIPTVLVIRKDIPLYGLEHIAQSVWK